VCEQMWVVAAGAAASNMQQQEDRARGGERVCEREGFKWSVSFPTSKR